MEEEERVKQELAGSKGGCKETKASRLYNGGFTSRSEAFSGVCRLGEVPLGLLTALKLCLFLEEAFKRHLGLPQCFSPAVCSAAQLSEAAAAPAPPSAPSASAVPTGHGRLMS